MCQFVIELYLVFLLKFEINPVKLNQIQNIIT